MENHLKKLLEEKDLMTDELRDKISSLGYNVKDTKDGMEITKK